MVREFIDGFSTGDLLKWTTNNGMVATSGITDMDNYCIRTTDGNSYLHKTITSRSEYYVSFRMRVVDTSVRNFFNFMKGSTRLAFLYRDDDATGLLRAKRGSTVISTGCELLVGATYLFEVRYVPSNTVGVMQVKVDGNLVIDVTTGNTCETADTTIDGIRLGKSYTYTGNNGKVYWNNIIIDSSGWIGDTRIAAALVPTGAGTTTEFDPSTGANWECVNEVPASDVDYNSTNVADEIDLFTLSNLTESIGEIKSLEVIVRGFYEGSPTPTKIAPVLRSGGNNYFGSDQSVILTPGLCRWLMEVDPDTSSVFSESSVNALEIGYKSRT